MGIKIGICGYQNSGKSYGRRYIPDGENVMIIAPSVKTPHLFTGPKGVASFTPDQIDKAITDGSRKVVKYFDIKSPDAIPKYQSLDQALDLIPDKGNRHLAFMLATLLEKKEPGYFGGMEGRKYITGNIMLCEELEHMRLFMRFVNTFMPWIHTIILPDFTHYITEVIISQKFLNRNSKDQAFARYIDLAADALRSFIKYADVMRKEMIVVSEYHVVWDEAKLAYVIFTPGGKLLTEKFIPSSYYDTFLFTDVKYKEHEEDMPDYRFVTRTIPRYPEARSIGGFEELYIPNNLQEVLTRVRKYNGIELINPKS